MKKTLEDELMSLAHRILHLRGREDLEQMKKLTGELYEKLSILSFAEKHFSGMQPTIGFQDVEETLSEIKKEPAELKSELTVERETSTATSISTEQKSKEVSEQEKKSSLKISSEAEQEVDITTPSKEDISEKKPTLEGPPKTPKKDMGESVKAKDDSEIDLREISVHFDDLPQFEPISLEKTEPQPEEEIFPEAPEPEPKKENEPEKSSNQAPSLEDLFPTSSKVKNRNESTVQKKSLNERLKVGLSFGLNDRLAFINNLFDGSAEDFNRVISQLNSFEHYSEAQDFIEDQVKPDYDWEDKTTYEERFLQALEQRMED